jgi:hypothetical protein
MRTRVLWSRAYLHVRSVDMAVVSLRIRIEKRLAPPSTDAGARANVFEDVHDGIVIGAFFCVWNCALGGFLSPDCIFCGL